MSRGDALALLHALSGAGALVVSLFTKEGFEGSATIFKPLGYAIFAVAMLLFGYSALFLKRAFGGNVEPITDRLITDGPYRVVRHPLYLSMVFALVGISIGMRSILGFVVSLALFIPLTVVRAKLEEAALEAKFGQDWIRYAQSRSFLIPLIW
jgi:protein-S-isoprenylcysteine O-methyltransferase Ste14